VKGLGRLTAFLSLVYLFSLPLLLIGLALRFYVWLPQGLKRTVLLVVGVQESVVVPLAPALALIFVVMFMAMSVAWTAFLSELWTARTHRALSEAVRALSDVDKAIIDLVRQLPTAPIWLRRSSSRSSCRSPPSLPSRLVALPRPRIDCSWDALVAIRRGFAPALANDEISTDDSPLRHLFSTDNKRLIHDLG
jgi:hypothetical protein